MLIGRVGTQKLTELFPTRMVSLNQPQEWSSRSPDLTLCSVLYMEVPVEHGLSDLQLSLEVLDQRIHQEILTLRHIQMVMVRHANECYAN